MNKNPLARSILLKAALWLQSHPPIVDLATVIAVATLILVGGYL